MRHGHRVVHHEPPRERRHVARLVLALDRRVGVERRPQLLEPLEPLRERRVEEERLEHEVRVHVERRRRVERPRHDGVADAQRAVALLVVEPRRQEHGPFHGVGRGGPEPADLQVAVGRGAHLRARRVDGARREIRHPHDRRAAADRPPPLVRAEPPAGHVPLVQIHEPGDAPARRRAPALRALGLLVVLVDVPRERRAGREARVRELVARRRRPLQVRAAEARRAGVPYFVHRRGDAAPRGAAADAEVAPHAPP